MYLYNQLWWKMFPEWLFMSRNKTGSSGKSLKYNAFFSLKPDKNFKHSTSSWFCSKFFQKPRQTLQSALNTLQNLKTWISHEKLTNPQIYPEIFLLNDKPVLRKQEIDCEHGSLVDGIKVWI